MAAERDPQRAVLTNPAQRFSAALKMLLIVHWLQDFSGYPPPPHWGVDDKRCPIKLGPSIEERSMLSLYAFSSDASAVLIRSRSLSSNVCQFGS